MPEKKKRSNVPKIQSLDEFLGERGLSSPVSDFSIDKIMPPHGETKRQKKKRMAQLKKIKEYSKRRLAAIAEYKSKVKTGEIQRAKADAPKKAPSPKETKHTPVKASKLTIGKVYREKVNSEQGYEDWAYTGKIMDGPNGKLYVFENDRGEYLFDEKDLKHFKEKQVKKAPKLKTLKQEKQVKKAPKLKAIKHDDNFEQSVGLDKPIIIKKAAKPKLAARKELRRVAKSGGFTAWDGRTGKTFGTEKEAKDYAADLMKQTGEIIPVSRTDRQVTHTYKAEQRSK